MIINKELYFDDLQTFWDYAMRESRASRKDSRTSSNLNCGGVSWDEAKRLAQRGWQEGLNEIHKYVADMSPIIAEHVFRPYPVNTVNGFAVDVGAFLSNNPECFFNRIYEETKAPGKVLKLVCSISFSWSITPQVIIQRGAMICALIDAIEYAGNRVEVVCNWSASSSCDASSREGSNKEKGWFETSVVVKKAGQPLDMCTLAFCLAHPAMLRRIMFSVAEIEGWSDFAYRYGYPASATDKGDLYIEEIFSGTVPNDKAIEWIFNKLSELGIKIEKK